MTPDSPDTSIEAALACPSIHFAAFSRIRDKDGKLIRPVPGNLQVKMQRAYEWCLANGVPCRLAVLKARQVYGSTAAAHLCYHHTRQFRVNGLVMADDESRTDGLWAMLCRFADMDEMAQYWGTAWHATRDRVRCKWSDEAGKPCEHTWGRETASDPKAGAAGTWQVIWFSEAARYPKTGVAQDSIVIGNAINAMPPRPNTLAIMETTAEGPVGYFADTYSAAVTLDDRIEGRIGNGWIKVFSAWHECDDYRLARVPANLAWFDNDDPRYARFAAREEVGRVRWAWTPEQIAWRRMKILSELNGNEQLFDRDFPDSEEVAFGASASAALDPEGLQALRRHSQGIDPMHGELVAHDARGAVVFVPSSREQGIVHIWEQPFAGARYLVAVDPMSGKSDITGSGEKDRHSVLVLRDAHIDHRSEVKPLKLVARIASPNQWDDKVIARWIALLARYYGDCTVAVEANCGGGIIEELRDAHSANLLHRPEFNKTTQRHETRLGWWTDKISRRIMIAELQDHIREQKIEIPCRHTVGELATLIVDKDGRVRASGRNHDDDAMALALGLACIKSATKYRSARVKRPLPVDHRRWKSVPAWT